MDMFISPEPVPGHKQGKPGRDWKTSWPVLAIAIAAWAMVTIWSVNFVAHSIAAAGIVQPDTPEWMLFGLAAGLQACVNLLGLLTPLFFRPFRTLAASVWAMCLAGCFLVIGFETYHQVFRGLQLSTGAGFERTEAAELEHIELEITQLAKQVTPLYQSKRKALLDSIGNAKDGRDQTGRPGCGPICVKRTELYEAATGRFDHLALAAVPSPAGNADLRSRLIDCRHRYSNLKALEASLIDFYQAIDGSEPPKMITDAIARLGAILTTKEREYAGIAVIDAKNIALARTAEAFGDIASGKLPRQDVWLSLAYGVLPSIAITILGIFIRLICDARGHFVGVADLLEELAAERRAAPILRELERQRGANFVRWLRVGYRRWDKYRAGWAWRAKRPRPAEPAAGDD